jgi:hypothetical protein
LFEEVVLVVNLTGYHAPNGIANLKAAGREVQSGCD